MDDRTMILSRQLAATPETVWAAWTDPDVLPQWFGPRGFSCRTKEIDLREGGVWRFHMIGPDGRVWPNRHRYTRHERPRLIEYILDDDDTSGEMQPKTATVTFEPKDGGTLLTMKMVFSSPEDWALAKTYHAVEMGHQTLDKLAERLGVA